MTIEEAKAKIIKAIKERYYLLAFSNKVKNYPFIAYVKVQKHLNEVDKKLLESWYKTLIIS